MNEYICAHIKFKELKSNIIALILASFFGYANKH